MNKTLSILLLEDDLGGEVPGITDSTRAWVGTMLGEVVLFENTRVATEALDWIRSDDYDVVLLDINLGDSSPFGGVETLMAAWPSLIKNGTIPIIYSADPDVQNAYKAFEADDGPFRFVLKASYSIKGESHADNLTEPLIKALRRRAYFRVQSASRGALKEALKNSTVWIGKNEWSVDSLVAPFMFPLPGERPNREAVIRSLFPGDDRVRVLSFWLKASDFIWPSNDMYGLIRHNFGGVNSGAMDLLTHDANDGNIMCYHRELIKVVNDELMGLKTYLDEAAFDRFKEYVDETGTWNCFPCRTCMPNVPVLNLPHNVLKEKGSSFKIDDVMRIIKDKTGADITIDDEVTQSKSITYYQEPGRERDKDSGRLLRGLAQLCISIAEAPGEDKSIWASINAIGKLRGEECHGDLPYLTLTVEHNGDPWENRSDVESYTSKGKGHKLGKAYNDLEGYCQWHILWSSEGSFDFYSPLGETLISRDDRKSYWDSRPEGATVLHIMKIGVPCKRGR